jgi:hypothetical protein
MKYPGVFGIGKYLMYGVQKIVVFDLGHFI